MTNSTADRYLRARHRGCHVQTNAIRQPKQRQRVVGRPACGQDRETVAPARKYDQKTRRIDSGSLSKPQPSSSSGWHMVTRLAAGQSTGRLRIVDPPASILQSGRSTTHRGSGRQSGPDPLAEQCSHQRAGGSKPRPGATGFTSSSLRFVFMKPGLYATVAPSGEPKSPIR